MEDVATVANVATVSVVDAEDLALVKLCIDRDAQAFTRLHDKYAGLLTSVLRKYFKNDDHRTADAVQDVFVRLVEKPERFSSFRGDSKLGTWLTRIAINIATTVMKKARKTPDGERLTKLRLTHSPAPRPDIELARTETFARIEAAMSEVPDDLRKLLMMDEELSYADMAAQLGITENQVRGGLYRARQVFRAAYEKGE